MAAAEVTRFIDALIPDYAREHVRQSGWDEGTALERARAEVAHLLPEGRDTPGHWFFSIVARPEQTPVGRLWFALRPPAQGGGGFIYDIEIDPPFRRRGHAREALLALEAFAREQGIAQIGLHVFGDNAGAIELYRQLGYETTNLLMRKRVRRDRV